jgi:3D (Asp-Asp-Asp) domain-containing protein
MKWIPLFCAAALLSAAASVFAARDVDKQIGQRLEKIRTTAYTHGAAENGAHPRSNAIGRPLKSGALSSAAADWSHWPMGTRFRVVETGREYIIDDVGGALVGTNTIDLFKPNSRAVDRWGVRDVTIEILEWGSPEESLEILKNRRKSRPARKMVARLLVQSAT